MYKISKHIELEGWRTMPAAKIEWCERPRCLCCETVLTIGCVLTDTRSTVRIGVCSRCGYVGYVDAPTEAWITNFYSTEWDSVAKKNVTDIHPPEKSEVVDQIKKYAPDTTSALFEVGTGYGETLRLLRDSGYSHLAGIDPSPHRKGVAEFFSGARVFLGSFGSKETREALKDERPRLIFSRSVLEHVYDPNEFFSLARDLQQEGDHLLVLVPNVVLEPTLNAVLFLPHLHGFTGSGLQWLAYRHGYETVFLEENKGILCVFRRSQNPQVPSERQSEKVDVVAKWRKELPTPPLSIPQFFYWSGLIDHARVGVVPVHASARVASLELFAFNVVRALPHAVRSLLLKYFWNIPRRFRLLEYTQVDDGSRKENGPLTIEMLSLVLYVK